MPFDFGTPLIIFAVLAIVGIIALRVLNGQGAKSKTIALPYEKQGALFTPSERSFYGVLRIAITDQYLIFGKVRLADLIRVKSGLSNSARQSALNRINRKHVDFVLCDAETLALACVIELDDKSHQAPERQERDVFVNGALRASGVPIVRFPAKQAYELAEVRAKLSEMLPMATPIPTAQPTTPQVQEKPEQKTCPKCGSEMVVRTAKRGSNAGQAFWACSAYPKCRSTSPLGGVDVNA